MTSALLDIGIIIIATAVVCGILRLLKQPPVIGYILTGLALGPAVFGVVKDSETLATFSSIGIAFLLFLVGLGLNPRVIKEVGKISLVTGIGQVLFTAIIGWIIAIALGFSAIAAAYISVALTFSSTIIIMKLLSDKGDLETLYGKIAIGFLIVQDFIAMAILIAISSATSTSVAWIDTVIRGIGLLILTGIAGSYLVPWVTHRAARSQELLMLFSVAWCLFLALIFEWAGFSIEIGALLAGITLAMSPFRIEISAKMRILRDFFIILFFIYLGSKMDLSMIQGQMLPLIIFSAFIIVGNPLIVVFLMGKLGYTKKNGFLAGVTVAQISEFSLILIEMGIKVGHLSPETLSLVTAIGVITIAGSTYMVLYTNKIYPYLAGFLSCFERKGRKKDHHHYKKGAAYEVVLFGYNRVGYSVLESFRKLRKRFLVVDFNPETIHLLEKEKCDYLYGDASDPELLNEINFARAKMVVSSIPDTETNLLVLKEAQRHNPKAIVIVVSHQVDDALLLYNAGATYVLMPHFVGGHYTATLIEEYKFNLDRFLKDKLQHIAHLQKRKLLGHEHPSHEREASA